MKSLLLLLLLAGFATLAGCEDAADPSPVTSEVESQNGHDHGDKENKAHD